MSDKDEFYRFWSEKIGVPQEKLRPWYDHEFEKDPEPDAPFEVPDKIEIFYKYSYGGQSRFFREIMKNGKLFAARCPDCGKSFCPPRHACPHCYVDTEWFEISGKGKVVAYTVQHYSTSSFITRVPFLVAYVKLEGTDFLMMTQIEMDVEKAYPGMPVVARFREKRHGNITDIYFEAMPGE